MRISTFTSLALLTSLASLAFAGRSNAADLTTEQKAFLSHAERHEKKGWVYLHIQGEARERGFQHGYLLSREIAEQLRVRRIDWKHETSMEWEWLVKRAGELFTAKIDAENLAEIDGMVEGMQAAGIPTSREELIAHNGYLELSWYWWPKEIKKIKDQPVETQKQACSSFIATGSMTKGGGVVLGHNTWFGYVDATANVILDIVPTKGHRIMMQTAPGWIHSGTDFFITSAGLVGSETTIGGFDGFEEKEVPEFVRFRRAVQDAGSIDEWCAIMQKGNNGGYANAWLIGDVNSGEIARLELGLKHVALERTKDGYFAGSNVAENLKILRLETDRSEVDIRSASVARRVRWKKLMAENVGKIDGELGKKFLADHYDSYLEKVEPGSRSLCGHSELDSRMAGSGTPFYPSGCFDAKVVTAKMAKEMSFSARWGAACGRPFDAADFLSKHPQFDWMKGVLKSRPTQPWTVFKAGESK